MGNISAEDGSFKQHLIDCGAIKPLVEKILQTNDDNVIKYTNWALTNLCRGDVASGKKVDNKILATTAFIKVIMTQDDLEVLSDALSALTELMENSLIQNLIQAGLVPRLIKIAERKYKAILYPLLQILSYISNGTDYQTQEILDRGGLKLIFDLLSDPTVDMICRKECLWIVSNVLVGTFDQVRFVFSHPDWAQILMKYCEDPNIKVPYVYLSSKEKPFGPSATLQKMEERNTSSS